MVFLEPPRCITINGKQPCFHVWSGLISPKPLWFSLPENMGAAPHSCPPQFSCGSFVGLSLCFFSRGSSFQLLSRVWKLPNPTLTSEINISHLLISWSNEGRGHIRPFKHLSSSFWRECGHNFKTWSQNILIKKNTDKVLNRKHKIRVIKHRE